MVLLAYLCVLALELGTAQAQVIPSGFSFHTSDVVSVNGSSDNGKCSAVAPAVGRNFSRCATPTSSVLFDGNIPTLTGLDGNMWASQLLTLQTTFPTATEIVFDFPTPTRVDRVEIVMFSCTGWGISAQTVRLFGPSRSVSSSTNLRNSSCNSLLKVCLSPKTTEQSLTLAIFPSPGSNWVHLAEVTFYAVRPVCTSDITVLPPSPPPPPTSKSTTMTTLTLSHRTMDMVSTNCGETYSSSLNPVLIVSVTAIATALLATVIFVLVQIAVCKCHPKFTPGGAETGNPAEGPMTEQGRKVMMLGLKEQGNTSEEQGHQYEIIQGRKPIQLQSNEAYHVKFNGKVTQNL